MHSTDMIRLGLQDDDHVTVRSDTGVMHNLHARTYDDIRAGNAMMYYPEANVLVSRTIDPQSRTPAFKCILITIEKSSAIALPVC